MTTPTVLRSSLLELSALAAGDLDALWRLVATADEARDALLDVLPALVDTYGAAAGTVAADWYDDLRESREVAGRFTAITAVSGDRGADALARWGVSPLFQAEPDWAAAATLIEGGLQRRITDVGRETVTVSSVQDPKVVGWARSGRPKCQFCSDLIGRGAVYSEATADFESHDHCGCVAVPVF